MTTTTTERVERREARVLDIHEKVRSACEDAAENLGPCTAREFRCAASEELRWTCTPYRGGGEFKRLGDSLIRNWMWHNLETVEVVRRVK